MSIKIKLLRIETPKPQRGFLGPDHTARAVITGGFSASDPFILLMDDYFFLATGLLPLVSKTASYVLECQRLRLAPNRKMSLLQELLYGECCVGLVPSIFAKYLYNPKKSLVWN